MSRTLLPRAAKKSTDYRRLALVGTTGAPQVRIKKKVSKRKPKVVAAASSTSGTKTKSSAVKARVFDSTTPAIATHSRVIWQYDDSGWKNYDDAASDVVEAAYQDWLQNPATDVRAVKSGEWQYQVDFNLKEQVNVQHEQHTVRKVRRTVVE